LFSPVWFLMQATQVWSLSRGSPRERGIKQGWLGRGTPQEPMPQLLPDSDAERCRSRCHSADATVTPLAVPAATIHVADLLP